MSIGGSVLASAKAREASISIVVTRADGTVEDHGVVTYWHRNPIKRWLGSLRIALNKRKFSNDRPRSE